MELVEQIRKQFAALSITEDKALLIDGFDKGMESWVIKINNSYAVGIEVDKSIRINEAFANVSFFTDYFSIGDQQNYLLLLSSSDETLRNEFAGICAVFLEVGDNGRKRIDLADDPIKWWQRWKELIGNKSVEKTIHGLLGELIVLYYLKKEIKNREKLGVDNWTGPNGKSVDIRIDSDSYEVKSSLIKYNNIITISGQYQLSAGNNLFLMFVKLEDVESNTDGDGSVSIDYLIKKLSNLGMDYEKLNQNVTKLGFKEHSLDRKRQFQILEVRKYIVDDEFPYLDVNSLGNVNKKENIIQVTYKIDLTGLDYELLGINFSNT